MMGGMEIESEVAAIVGFHFYCFLESSIQRIRVIVVLNLTDSYE